MTFFRSGPEGPSDLVKLTLLLAVMAGVGLLLLIWGLA